MKQWPAFNTAGDLPPGIHRATLAETIEHFSGSARRAMLARRLERIYRLADGTHSLARFIIFGSFITSKLEPNDIDIFLLMENSFDVRIVALEAGPVFDHVAAQNVLGGSIFWLRRAAALGGEEETVKHWQIKRDGCERGIVEVIK